jgi:hypothetical protein
VLLSMVGVGGIVTILIVRPPPADNTGIIVTMLGFLIPIVTALLAAAVQEVHLAVNSRLTEFLALTAKSARAQGQLDATTAGNIGQTGAAGVDGSEGPRGQTGATGPRGPAGV